MGRSGYTDDCEQWALIRWRGAVASSMRGRKGQAFLVELLAALDAMPEKRLIAQSFSEEGSYCTLGVIGASRGVTMPVVVDEDDEHMDPSEIRDDVCAALGIPDALAAEIMDTNDEGGWNDTPEQRWSRMRRWVAGNIKAPAQPAP